MTAVRIVAPAKINLYLHILGKRTDGLHSIESLAAFTEFGDTLEIAKADTLTLQVAGPFADALSIAQDQNLVMQAAATLRLRSGCNEGARIVLHKQLPIGAGLGGGSSDAAAVLLGLYRFWKIGYERDEEHMLAPLARKLGSDVPVCLTRQAAIMRGAGEQVTSIPNFPEIAVVLVNPMHQLLTADVYKKFSGPFSAASHAPIHAASLQDLVKMLREKRNDLQPPAVALLPEINNVLAAIQATHGCLMTRMSGSGPTCFGLYADMADAQKAAVRLQDTYTSWWCVATHLSDWQNHGG